MPVLECSTRSNPARAIVWLSAVPAAAPEAPSFIVKMKSGSRIALRAEKESAQTSGERQSSRGLWVSKRLVYLDSAPLGARCAHSPAVLLFAEMDRAPSDPSGPTTSLELERSWSGGAHLPLHAHEAESFPRSATA